MVIGVSLKGKEEEAYLLDLAPLQVSEGKWCEKCHFFDKYNKIKSFYHCAAAAVSMRGCLCANYWGSFYVNML